MRLHTLLKKESDSAVILINGLNASFESNLDLFKNTDFDGSIYSLEWDNTFAFWPNIQKFEFEHILSQLTEFVHSFIQVSRNAEKAGKYLANELNKLRESNLYFVAHSMGSRVAIRTLLSGEIHSHRIQQVLLFNGAASYSKNTLEEHKLFFLNKYENKIVNYYNPQDPALKVLAEYLDGPLNQIPILDVFIEQFGLFNPIGLATANHIEENCNLLPYQGEAHGLNFLSKSLNYNSNKKFKLTPTFGENMNSSNENQGNTNIPNNPEIVEEMDKKADAVIFKYSIAAGFSGAIPIPIIGEVLDIAGDTLIQYQLVNELKKIYKIEDSFDIKQALVVVLDNILIGKLISITTGILKWIPVVGQTLIPFAKYIVDFAYTFVIGTASKLLFRTSFQTGIPPVLSSIPKLIGIAFEMMKEYLTNNWKNIFFTRKFILEKYEVDLDKLLKEFTKTNTTRDDLTEKTLNNFKAIDEELGNLAKSGKDTIDIIEDWVVIIGQPSYDLELAQARLKKMNGKTIEDHFQFILDLEESNSNANKRLN